MITGLGVTLGIGLHVNIFINLVVSAHIGGIQWLFPQHRDVILQIAYLSMRVCSNLKQILVDAEGFAVLGKNEIRVSQIFVKAKIFHVWVVLWITAITDEVHENAIPCVFVNLEFLGLLKCLCLLVNLFEFCDDLCLCRIVVIFSCGDLNNLLEKIVCVIFTIFCVRPLEFREAFTFHTIAPKDDAALLHNIVIFNVLTQRLDNTRGDDLDVSISSLEVVQYIRDLYDLAGLIVQVMEARHNVFDELGINFDTVSWFGAKHEHKVLSDVVFN